MRTSTKNAVMVIVLMSWFGISASDLSSRSVPRRCGKVADLPQEKSSVQQEIPDTPAGQTLKAWLVAFNSGDPAAIETYCREHDPTCNAKEMTVFRSQNGGFKLLEILKSEPLRIEFGVEEKNSHTRGIGTLTVKTGEPTVVKSFDLRVLLPKTSLTETASDLNASTRVRVIDGAIAMLNEFYVSPNLAKAMADTIRARQKRGEYDSVTDGDIFANMLTHDLQDVSHDRHLRVDFSPAPLPENPPLRNPATDAQFRKQMERTNCGFEEAAILPGNVGYLKFDMFADPSVCGPTAVAAMNFLSNADAIIFDLRDNGGGDPRMVALIATYLFSKPTHLNDLWERQGDLTQQFWTLPYVPGTRLDSQPVYVLTSSRTFSAAEEFCYDLKNLKRATIVGETTGGGAHPVAPHRINAHFTIDVPFAKAINPISKTNWEGTGVEPDVEVAADDALSTAEKLAAEKLKPQ
jgi:retinol-binding protein 3